jgi:hypothetical protein
LANENPSSSSHSTATFGSIISFGDPVQKRKIPLEKKSQIVDNQRKSENKV